MGIVKALIRVKSIDNLSPIYYVAYKTRTKNTQSTSTNCGTCSYWLANTQALILLM